MQIQKWFLNILTILFAHSPLIVFADNPNTGINQNQTSPRLIQKQIQTQEQEQKLEQSKTNTPLKSKPETGEESTESEKFFAENKKKPGMNTLPSGVQYKQIKAGKGKSPELHDFVKLKYQGKLLNGTVFDSSEKNGSSTENFEVRSLIHGLEEAVMRMSPGSVWEIYLPADQAYGKKGIPGKVPPNTPLSYKIELIEIVPRPDESDTNILEREDVEERQEQQ